jgi:hypothetical protein
VWWSLSGQLRLHVGLPVSTKGRFYQITLPFVLRVAPIRWNGTHFPKERGTGPLERPGFRASSQVCSVHCAQNSSEPCWVSHLTCSPGRARVSPEAPVGVAILAVAAGRVTWTRDPPSSQSWGDKF